MAQAAISQWVEYLTDRNQEIPSMSDWKEITTEADEFVNLIRAEIRDNHAVKRTVSIPKWMDDKVIDSGLSLSRVLQDALKERLNVG